MPKSVLASISLLLLTNAVVLLGILYNRSGEPLASLELTERELPVHWSYTNRNEDSSTRLSLNWRVLGTDLESGLLYGRYSKPAWLDNAKLDELGFDLEKFRSDIDKHRYQWDTQATDAVLVLEYQGESYQQALAHAEQLLGQLRKSAAATPRDTSLAKKLIRYENHYTNLKVSGTRLYVIDAGLDEQLLIEKYGDKTKYMFLHGEIGLSWDGDDIVGNISHLYVEDVHVPLPYSQTLVSLTAANSYYNNKRETIPPRYKVRLNVGKRLEPWIELVE